MNALSVKRRFKILAVAVLLIGLSACNQGTLYKEDVSVASADISEDYEAISDQNQHEVLSKNVSTNQIPKDLKIIKSASARYKVKNVRNATNSIKKMALRYNAYISDLRFENDLYRKENRFTIKIPQQYFDAMMDSISNVVEFVDYENITTKDVTEDYIDLETRLKTKLEVKERYETILRKNAKTVEAILATEDKLRIIQEEIEAAQGRLKYLTNKVAYSTIQIDLYEAVEYKEEPIAYNKTFWSKSKEGLSFGWHFIENVVLGIIHIWPLVIIGVLVFYLIRKKVKTKKNRG